jgi:hypothetical protein
MGYRIQVFRADLKMGDIASDGPLPDTREDALDAISLFKGDYALIVDDTGQLVDRLKRSA